MTQKTFSPGSKGMQFKYITRPVVGLLALLFFSSCTTKKPVKVVDNSQVCQSKKIEKKIEKKNTVVDDSKIRQLEQKIAELSRKLAEQKLLSKKLQQTLLIKHKETDACRQANEKLIKELSQSKAKLATRGSKLEAATLIAEATAVISTVEQKPLNEPQKIVRERALENLKESKHELAEGNYESASYLSREAMVKAKGIDIGDGSSTAHPAEKEIFFSTPLQMKLFTTGNLRKGPSINAGVKKILQEGRCVIAVGHKQNWVKVKLADTDETGWIHLSLLY
ncbi:SH3 domain-containing protein [Desulfobacter hydrogenophilus]|uniref:SH3 domain-containing protein n=1 Tax=Desulfobacter hydrogenophilus TaxID=2291 RepID=A0A328FJM0_9BACT|nr:SH3 domain-containing protein [Desulfobacter hydrogenophilus]NDY70735.1 SH3 domain-containing protein [Desulfobacter hydrogenophilus]QBH12652.1 SH3 domain-containing protein [Desulfobacter hydrogenophilus]RAM03383.1 SH3 domain-containing protein [Desulfobacter hydrogenophilus]